MSGDFKFRIVTGDDWALYQGPALTGTGGALRLADDLQFRDGEYITLPLDSGLEDCRWRRIEIDADVPDNAAIAVSCFASANGALPAAWPAETIFKSTQDALAPDRQGRYLRVRIRLRREGQESPVLRTLRAFYPGISYLRYLPALYQLEAEHQDFQDRFLSAFETPLSGLEETIADGPRFFDPLAAPAEFISWLASWLSLDLYELLGDRNREFILRAMEFYKRKGTPAGLASLVSFLTGKRCCVKEYMHNVFRSYGMEHLEGAAADEFSCRGGGRTPSRTVDTGDAQLLSTLGTHVDGVHYVMDTRDGARYAPHVVGIFIFLSEREKAFIIDKNKLLKIIRSFLPVHVRVDIVLVEELEEVCPVYLTADEQETSLAQDLVEAYRAGGIADDFESVMTSPFEETGARATGLYSDVISRVTFYSWRTDKPDSRTNDPRYLTMKAVKTADRPA